MNSMIQTQLLKDILENNILYEVEDIEGKLEYKLDENYEKVRICVIDEIEWSLISLCGEDGACILSPQKKVPEDIQNNNLEVSFIPLHAIDETIGKIKEKIVKNYDDVSNGYTFFQEGDILFAKVTPSMENGNCIITKDIKNKIGFASTELNTIRCKDNVYNKFIWQILRSKHFRDEAKRTMKGTGGLLRVPSSFFHEYEVSLPREKNVNTKIYSSYKLQQSIAKNIEEKLNSLEYKINILKTMITLKKLEIDNILLNIFEKKFENYITIDNTKIFLKDITYKQIKLYESKDNEEKFIATKRMGFTLSDSSSEINLVEWLTIDDLNKVEGLYIGQLDTKTKISLEDVYIQYSEDSDKRKAIQIGDILVSFKMTIGVTKIYNSEQIVYCNEAIDIINICDKEKYDRDYISFLIGNEYKKYTLLQPIYSYRLPVVFGQI